MFTQLSADSTLTIAPPPFFARIGAKARLSSSGPKKLVSNSARSAVDAVVAEERRAARDAGVVDDQA